MWKLIILLVVVCNVNVIGIKLHLTEFVGCYMDQETRTLNGKMTISTKMTVDSCRKTCTNLKFKYYGVEYSEECFCGNKLTTITKMRDGDCLKPCTGDKTQACGGDWRIAVYENPYITPPKFVGCYMDQQARTLNEKMTVSTTMTVDSCRKTCTDLKFKYYGVEYGKECFCGNKLTTIKKMRDGDCLKPCTGDKTQACGGYWRIALYVNPYITPPTAIVKKEFVGCYMDQQARTLNEKKTISTTMTVDSCRKTCTDLKFKYYGVEYGKECFCGNKLTTIKKMRDGDCLNPCTGDKTQACGGDWRIALYVNPYITPPTAIVKKEFVGCYMDQQARTLNEKKTISTTMTVDSCRKTCTDLKFKYYGVEYGKECFCGNKLTTIKKMRDGDCLNPCTGDKTQACGGDWRIALYVNPYITPPTAIVKKEFVGCYMDQQARTLNEKKTISTTMTVDSCRKTCTDLKFKYYGVEYGKECFCGNKLTTIKKMRDGDCLKPCTGDKTQACGGDWRIALYVNPYITPPTAIVKKEFVGCYMDQQARTLNEKKTISTTMTVDSCRKTCTDLKFKYYGVEYGKECFCGNKLTTIKKMRDGDCLKPCTGDKTQACGGDWRIALYVNPYITPPKFVGCYMDQQARTLNEKKTISTTMTVDSCRKTCTDLKFKYYGVEYGKECFCGNKLTTIKKMRDGDCLKPCTGDKTQACGGDWRIALYVNPYITPPTAIVKKEFVGCYMDQQARTLNEKKTISTTMTVDSCRKTCTDLKFKYYGVEYGKECFCGNKLTTIKKMRDGDCLKPCTGDKTQACGGDWRIALYVNPYITPPKFVGCYMDQQARTLNEKKTISTTMTVDSCRKTCTDLKFKYYGVEYGKECFCGNKLTTIKKMRDGDCLKPCTGDKTQACGGDWRIALYVNPYITPPTAIVKKEFVGCYMDQQARTLNEKKTISTTMTVDSCRKTCTDLKFKYYGVEYGKECFCGNKLTTIKKMRDVDCLKPCTGDKTQACGGDWRIALYVNPYITPPTAIVEKEFVGCYMDQQARTLNEKKTISTTMTVDSCRKTCTDLKFKYYGVEYGKECFCGNKLTTIKKMRDSDCLQPCTGDKTQACGGDWRIALYVNSFY
ncbi:uncharacterized protein [Magallana gigas]|uniref:uncharacterized protein isoform X2 n=1 Tax=Magallana gigas TaxID=29159 RepID=UPI003342B3AC